MQEQLLKQSREPLQIQNLSATDNRDPLIVNDEYKQIQYNLESASQLLQHRDDLNFVNLLQKAVNETATKDDQ